MRSQIHNGFEGDRSHSSALISDSRVFPIYRTHAIYTDILIVVHYQLEVQVLVLPLYGEAHHVLCHRSVLDINCHFCHRNDILVHSVYHVGIAIARHESCVQYITFQVGTHYLFGNGHSDFVEQDRSITRWSHHIGIVHHKILCRKSATWITSLCIPVEADIVSILWARPVVATQTNPPFTYFLIYALHTSKSVIIEMNHLILCLRSVRFRLWSYLHCSFALHSVQSQGLSHLLMVLQFLLYHLGSMTRRVHFLTYFYWRQRIHCCRYHHRHEKCKNFLHTD